MREIRQSGLTRGEAAAIVLPLSYSTGPFIPMPEQHTIQSLCVSVKQSI